MDQANNRVPAWTMTIAGQDYEAEIAEVEQFHLGYEDHGLFTATVSFKAPGWGQGLPARALDTYDDERQERVGTAFGMDFVIQLVNTIGSPENAKGRRVVVLRREKFGFIDGVAALKDDGTIGTPFLPDALAEQHYSAVVTA